MANETELEVVATRCEFPDYAFSDGDGVYYQFFHKFDPLPTDWANFDNQPQETMQLVALCDVQVLLAKKDADSRAAQDDAYVCGRNAGAERIAKLTALLSRCRSFIADDYGDTEELFGEIDAALMEKD